MPTQSAADMSCTHPVDRFPGCGMVPGPAIRELAAPHAESPQIRASRLDVGLERALLLEPLSAIAGHSQGVETEFLVSPL